MKNFKWFEDFIKYYNKEKEYETADLSEIKFLRDEVVLTYALNTLINLFGTIEKIPKTVSFSYFALLKGIELGAEKK